MGGCEKICFGFVGMRGTWVWIWVWVRKSGFDWWGVRGMRGEWRVGGRVERVKV